MNNNCSLFDRLFKKIIRELRQYGYHVCYKQEPLSYFKELKMRTFGFWQKETGAKRMSMTTTIGLLFCVFCDEHFWCQVQRTLLLYFQRYALFSILQFWLHNLWRHHFPNLHNRKTSISLKREKIFQKGKCHYYLFEKKPVK